MQQSKLKIMNELNFQDILSAQNRIKNYIKNTAIISNKKIDELIVFLFVFRNYFDYLGILCWVNH